MTREDLRGAVLVTVDSLRADAPETMPTLTALGERGARFENAFATGNWTPFSFPSILGADPVFTTDGSLGPSDRPTLAETLRDAGVETAGFNAANGFLTPHWGYDRGFDRFEAFTDGTGWLDAHPTVHGWLQFAGWPLRRARDTLRGDGGNHAVDTSKLLAVEERATDFLDTVEGPFFLWVHLMDTHTPYVPAPRYVREVTDGSVGTLGMLRAHVRAGLGREVSGHTLDRLRALYDAAALQVDDALSRLLDTLDATGLRDDTLVVVAGDHGEEFTEHGHLAHYPKLYDELAHVPLVVDDPRAEGRVVDTPVSLDTVPATIAEALGVAGAFDGRSSLSVVTEGEQPPADPVVSVALRGETVTQQPIPRTLADGDLLASARSARWTYIHNTADGSHELYDRRADPGEGTNIWPEESGSREVRRLRDAVEAHLDRIVDDEEAEELPDDVKERLETLGYR
ncbi:sulfatase [Halosegnis marinus]|uniref:Sulfatase n=1 Tax=Halosegnis marinus TaxID=3034023 RepID=A0ABD5ZSQ5_9EURY|nr:sulfatase [Halosegnis sp. DT85]